MRSNKSLNKSRKSEKSLKLRILAILGVCVSSFFLLGASLYFILGMFMFLNDATELFFPLLFLAIVILSAVSAITLLKYLSGDWKRALYLFIMVVIILIGLGIVLSPLLFLYTFG